MSVPVRVSSFFYAKKSQWEDVADMTPADIAHAADFESAYFYRAFERGGDAGLPPVIATRVELATGIPRHYWVWPAYCKNRWWELWSSKKYGTSTTINPWPWIF